jgi:hypothetical protein
MRAEITAIQKLLEMMTIERGIRFICTGEMLRIVVLAAFFDAEPVPPTRLETALKAPQPSLFDFLCRDDWRGRDVARALQAVFLKY